jgi:hypothetical protein
LWFAGTTFLNYIENINENSRQISRGLEVLESKHYFKIESLNKQQQQRAELTCARSVSSK